MPQKTLKEEILRKTHKRYRKENEHWTLYSEEEAIILRNH
jgi:hypothetical protein